MEAGSRPLEDGFKVMTREGNKLQILELKDEIDRLSLLPDSIIVDILSLIPIESAAATSVLSRRWHYLWTQVTHLVFNLYHHLPRNQGSDRLDSFFGTINHILSQLTASKIHSFCLKFPLCTFEDEKLEGYRSSLESWMRTICSRHAESIEVTTPFWSSITVPNCILQCQSVVELALSGALNIKVPDCGLVVALPNLKNLNLRLNVLDTELLAKLFKSCPLLEELTLSGQFTEGSLCLDLSAHNLKNLDIEVFEETLQGLDVVINLSKLEKISLDAPSLAYVRFVEHSGALISAVICIESGLISGSGCLSNTTELAQLISNVKSLCLNINILGALNDLDDDLLSPLENLTDLSIKSGMLDDANGSWNDVLHFLRRSPNIEVLLIEFETHTGMIKWALPPNFAPPFCLTQIKRINIRDLRIGDGDDDIKMMAYILSNAEALEVLSVYVSVTAFMDGMWDEYKLCDTLFHLDRLSLTCEIQFFGQHLTLSSKGFNNTIPCCQIFRLGNLFNS